MPKGKTLKSTASVDKPVSGPVSLSRSFGEDSIPQSHLRVVLMRDILEQSGIFDDYDSLAKEIFYDKMFLFGWAEVQTLREALVVLRRADDVPPKVTLYATAILGAMSELKPDVNDRLKFPTSDRLKFPTR